MSDPAEARIGSLSKQHNSELLLAGGMMGILFVLLVPMPPFLLDIAITLNLGLAVLVMLLTMSVKAPLEFSTFPSLLLFATLYRLALNVASTRLILGGGNAGRVIQSFGDFVIQGNLLVGLVIFLILVTIQFVVITKGSNRISEVAARFTLDAMPGKQMAIDADLNAGLITEQQARDRRERITQEAEFYGAMDGSGKFVRGDAIASLIITAVNLIGGVGIGMMKDMPLADALRKYAVLTTGDGLVTQIPALVIAISAGILVTKTRSAERLSSEMTGQFLMSPRAARMTAGIVFLLGLAPGMPLLPFTLLALVFMAVGRMGDRRETGTEEPEDLAAKADDETAELTPEVLGELLRTDRMAIEIGYRLIPLVDEKRKGGLLDHISLMRRQFARQHGFVVPPIRMRDNLTLDPNTYRILMSGEEVARGALHPDHVLAMNPGLAEGELAGIKTTDPTFGLEATWVPLTDKPQAEALGFTTIDPDAVLITHLTEVIRSHAHELISREDVQVALDRVKEVNPTVVNELVPDILPVGTVQKVLAGLLRERIPIRNLPTILEVLADHGRQEKAAESLVEHVRLRLGRFISELHSAPDGKVPVLTLDPGLEQRLAAAFEGRTETEGGEFGPGALRQVQEAVIQAWQDAQGRGFDPVLLVRAALRRHLAELFGALRPPIPVLSFNEIVAARGVEAAGVVQIRRETARADAPGVARAGLEAAV